MVSLQHDAPEARPAFSDLAAEFRQLFLGGRALMRIALCGPFMLLAALARGLSGPARPRAKVQVKPQPVKSPPFVHPRAALRFVKREILIKKPKQVFMRKAAPQPVPKPVARATVPAPQIQPQPVQAQPVQVLPVQVRSVEAPSVQPQPLQPQAQPQTPTQKPQIAPAPKAASPHPAAPGLIHRVKRQFCSPEFWLGLSAGIVTRIATRIAIASTFATYPHAGLSASIAGFVACAGAGIAAAVAAHWMRLFYRNQKVAEGAPKEKYWDRALLTSALTGLFGGVFGGCMTNFGSVLARAGTMAVGVAAGATAGVAHAALRAGSAMRSQSVGAWSKLAFQSAAFGAAGGMLSVMSADLLTAHGSVAAPVSEVVAPPASAANVVVLPDPCGAAPCMVPPVLGSSAISPIAPMHMASVANGMPHLQSPPVADGAGSAADCHPRHIVHHHHVKHVKHTVHHAPKLPSVEVITIIDLPPPPPVVVPIAYPIVPVQPPPVYDPCGDCGPCGDGAGYNPQSAPYGAPPYGASPYGAESYNAAPYGTSPYGGDPYHGQGTAVYTTSEADPNQINLQGECATGIDCRERVVYNDNGDADHVVLEPGTAQPGAHYEAQQAKVADASAGHWNDAAQGVTTTAANDDGARVALVMPFNRASAGIPVLNAA